MRKRNSAVVLLAVLILPVGNAVAAPYKFTNLYDSSGPFENFGGFSSLGGPSLNNSGTVAFGARLDTGEEGIFTGSGGSTTTTIADTRGPFNSLLAPSLNNRGTVAFRADLDTGGAGIFVGSGGPTTTIANSASFDDREPFLGLFDGPSLNDNGTVAFYFENLEAANSVGVFTGAGGPLSTIADTSTEPFLRGGAPSINNSGMVAFPGFFHQPGIFIGNGGPVTNITTDSPLPSFFESPSLNDSGTVAFVAGIVSELTDSGPFASAPSPGCEDFEEQGVFTSSGGLLTTIARCFPIRLLLFPSLNNSGKVAFFAEDFDTGAGAIFTGPDLVADKVIGTGDTVFGSMVVGLGMSRESLNDAGQIGFVYRLADGSEGVARADPLVIPEPGTLPLLFIAGLLGAVVWRREINADRS